MAFKVSLRLRVLGLHIADYFKTLSAGLGIAVMVGATIQRYLIHPDWDEEQADRFFGAVFLLSSVVVSLIVLSGIIVLLCSKEE